MIEAAGPSLDVLLDHCTPAYRAEFDHFVTVIETGTQPAARPPANPDALLLADAANQRLRAGRVGVQGVENMRRPCSLSG